MSVSLNKEQLSCLLEQLQDKEDSIFIRGEIKSQLESITTDYDFVVDNWPDFRAIVGRIDPMQTKEIKLPGFFEHRVVVYCTDDDSLVSLLRQPAVLDWKKRHTFLFPKKSTAAVIVKGIPRCTVDFGSDLHLMIVRRHNLKLQPLPEGFRILPIQQDQAAVVNSTWKLNKGRHSELYILKVITRLPSCCLYDGEGKVVGFAIQYHNGALGMLYVHEEYRGKGYAKVIVSHLAKTCLEKEREVFIFVDDSNKASFSLHKSLGFEDYGVTHVAVNKEM